MEWWHWVVAGLVLLAVEMMTPGGFVVIFFGAAAVVVGLVGALTGLRSVGVELLLFSILSIAGLLLFRKRLLAWASRRTTAELPANDLVGETVVLSQDLKTGEIGKCECRGTVWNVRNADEKPLPKGQRARVERTEGLTLVVKAA
jgi:hypothetical protein